MLFIQSDFRTILTHIHTPKAVSTMQGDSQFPRSRRVYLDTQLGGAGIKLAAFQFQVHPFYLLS